MFYSVASRPEAWRLALAAAASGGRVGGVQAALLAPPAQHSAHVSHQFPGSSALVGPTVFEFEIGGRLSSQVPSSAPA